MTFFPEKEEKDGIKTAISSSESFSEHNDKNTIYFNILIVHSISGNVLTLHLSTLLFPILANLGLNQSQG